MLLSCPLCCGEKFACHESLKYHLLSMTVNLYCPACNQLCDGIPQLTDHLDSECGKPRLNMACLKQELSDEENTASPADTEQGAAGDHRQEMEVESALGENGLEIGDADDNLLTASLNGTAMMLEDGSIVVTTDENSEVHLEEPESEEVYSCSSCGVNFTSVMEHIEQFHDGQEVVVEMAENDGITEEREEMFTQTLDDSKLHELMPNEKMEDELDSSDSDEIDPDMKYPQILNTLKQEECVDKDGRVYTRKVVQIEKFWDDMPVKGSIPLNLNRRQPICEVYYVDEDGKLNKADKENPFGDDHVVENRKLVKLFNCSRCKMQFSKISQFNKHTCDPERASDYKCSHCEASFNNPKSLCAHMKAHKVVKLDCTPAVAPFLCTKCDTVFPTNKSLRLHQRMHEPIKAKEIEAPVEYGITGAIDINPNKPREMFICPVCNKSYDKGYEMIHMATHNGEDDYHCDICNRKFFTHENLDMHMRVHNGGKPFSCTYCKSAFDSSKALTEHMEVHTKDRPYSCGYCGRKFARPHEKVKHERIHTGEKPHECEICGKTFRVSYCLTLHMRTHTGARPYVCKHCGKRFKAHSVYNHHLLTHSDQRNYKCPYCPKAFKTGVQLAGHKNSHTKPFSCTVCNRPFASLYAVRSHMESHKRENNLKFSCYLCGASYARNFALRDHIKEVHHTTPVVLSSQGGNVTMVSDSEKVDLEEIEDFKATTSILPDNDETEMALNQLREDTSDEDM